MGIPNIPDISPTINLRDNDVVNLLLVSIALEEFSFADIINAEAGKLQELLGGRNFSSLQDIIVLSNTIEKILNDIVKKEMLLDFKMQRILELIKSRE